MILDLGFEKNQIDPCMFLKQQIEQKCFICLYVDDGIIAGDKELVEEVMLNLSKAFKLKIQSGIDNFLGCEIKIQGNERWIKQSRIITKMKDEWVNTSKLKNFKTPVVNGYKAIRPKDEEIVMGEKDQKLFRSGIGTLMYMVKLTRPEMSNCVREMSKVMYKGTVGQLKMLKRMIN